MPQGLQCFDEHGNLVLDITDRITRVLGVVETGITGGSIIDDFLLSGTPWFYAIGTFNSSIGWQCWVISFTGNTMLWTPINTITVYNTRIIYGVY